MTNYTRDKCAALASAIMAAMLVVSTPLRAAEEQKRPATPRSEKPEQRDSETKMNEKNRSDCKKFYRIVHRGPPGKGFDQSVLDRVECPIERA